MKQPTILFYLLLISLISSCGNQETEADTSYGLNLANLVPVATTDARYQSVNVEMCEVVGGEFWIPYEDIDTARVRELGFAALKQRIPAIDLYDEKLRRLAAALGPLYVRVSGTWANTTYFQDDDAPRVDQPPPGYENVLTRQQWKGVIDFCRATDARLVTSFAISEGIRDEYGQWTPAQVGPLLAYTRAIGGEIYAAEMFNEPSHASHGGAPAGYDAARYADDFRAFEAFVSEVAPEMKIMGPGSTGEGGIMPGIDTAMTTEKMLTTASPAGI